MISWVSTEEPLGDDKAVQQFPQREAIDLGAGGTASEKIVLLLKPQRQGGFTLGIIRDLAEVMEVALDLLGPPSGGVGEKGKSGRACGVFGRRVAW